MIIDEFRKHGEFGAVGMYEEANRSLFYRKALGIRRFYESCELASYNGEALYPSGCLPNKAGTCIFPSYLKGMDMNYNAMSKKSPELAELFASEFSKYSPSVPKEHTVAGNMYTHSMPNYERILKEGLLSYIDRINKIDDKDMREGLIHLIRGIEAYIERCVDYLTSENADEKLINALKKVPLHPADSIYEAVLAWNFILYLDGCDNLGCVASGLLPYYKGEDITDLLANLYDNLDKNGGYSMALDSGYSPLTLQCLEASKGKRRPMIELFVNENTPDDVWKKAFEVIKSGGGQPAFYNDNIIGKGLMERFENVTKEDAKRFCGGGCTEAMLAGLSNVDSLAAGINLPLILEKTIGEKLCESVSFEEFYKYYICDVQAVVDKVTLEISNSRRERAKYNPLPMRTLLVDDCIDKGLDFNNGGARYKWSVINFAGLVNVIDSMLVIKDFVFDKKRYSSKELVGLLENNDGAFLAEARKCDLCYGADSHEANEFSKRISTEIFSMLDNKPVYMGEGFLPASIQFQSQVTAGRAVGATPDGRESASPLADSLAPIFGKDINGPTALLRSVTSLDLKRALGIPVLNFNVDPEFSDETLKALILGYMALGGVQMQLTCTCLETLLEAYENPEMHRNLIVRVGGYSEYFHVLNDGTKKMIIERSIQKLR